MDWWPVQGSGSWLADAHSGHLKDDGVKYGGLNEESIMKLLW